MLILDSSKALQVVDSDGLIELRFDNSEALEELEARLERAHQYLDGLLLSLAAEPAALRQLQDAAPAVRSQATTQLEDLRKKNVSPATLEALAEVAEYTMLVKAKRKTRSNARSELAIDNWTEGTPEEVQPRDLPSRIQKLLDDLNVKAITAAKAMKKNEKERADAAKSDPSVQSNVDAVANVEQTSEAKEAEKDLEHIRRSILGFLPVARLELDRSGVERGDSLDLVVEFHREPPTDEAQGDEDTAPPAKLAGKSELVGMIEYHTAIDDLGWETHVRPQLIFFRGTGGTSAEKDWQANAAGLVEWAYRFRDPHSVWQEFVNYWEPGIGIHVASLDQGEDSVEVGVGTNLSLFRGLVSTGWGYNLSEDDHYYFVGGDILKLLDTVKELAQ